MDDIRRPQPRKNLPPPQPAQTPRLALPAAPAELLLSKTTSSRSWYRRKWLWWLVGVTGMLLLIVGVLVAGFLWYTAALQPLASSPSRIRIVISSGETADIIGKKLETQHVIKSATAFGWYVRQQNELNDLKAGTYLLSPTQSVQEITQLLVEGKVDTYNVTILPGQTLAQIKQSLIKDGFAATDVDKAFAKKYDSPLLADKPASATLEGYIFPETYQITSETTVEQLLEETFAEFYSRIQKANLQTELSGKGFSLYQAITLASIVQLEANTSTDRQQVAQVFELRLQRDMELGSDVTYMYAAKQLGVAASPDLDSPYNTRKYKGLPPGPIATITMDSLDAVAHPAAGDYLYFIVGDNGQLHFAHTEAEHQQNISLYCQQLCQ